mgnify:CR=1 FL=1
MSWSQHLRSAQDFMKVGDEVEAVILTLDREERKMSLGIKQLKPDPWENIETKYAVGSRHKAKVRNFTNFGVFVEIEEGVDGLIHISDLSWTKKIKHPSEFTQIGAEIEVQVLEIDKENRRLSLGHKQLEENPWDVFETIFTVDSIHEGTIVEMLDKGAVIALPYGVEGFATPKHLVKQDGTQAQVEEKLGRIDILVNNAGLTRDNLFIRMSDEDWQLVLDVNLSAGFKLAKAAVRGMMKRRFGRIIGIASVVGVTGNAGQANYSASKAGMIAMNKCLAQEVGSRGITVNSIAPGFIRTPMTDVLPEDVKAALLAKIPEGKLGEAQDIANVVAFLASDEAQYITGQTININGGMAMI